MTAAKPEQRITPTRLASRFSAYRDLSLVYEGHSETLQLRSPDISARGMFIHTARHFPEGAVMKLQFTLSRSGHEVRARAEVRYCLEGVGVGVEFVDISPADQQAIADEIADLMQK